MRVSRPSSRLSFDDLIELRFLPSRRRRRDPEYFEQLKSMIMPPEVNHRVSQEDRRTALLALVDKRAMHESPKAGSTHTLGATRSAAARVADPHLCITCRCGSFIYSGGEPVAAPIHQPT
jgi:hypothetical protein